MPGLKQLKKFSEDVAALGNEYSTRSERGEPFVSVPLPGDVPDIDDSDDFLLGMPLEDEENSLHPEPVIPGDQTNFSKIPSAVIDDSSFPEPEYDPDVSRLLNSIQDDIVLPEVEPDLDAFGDVEDNLQSINTEEINNELNDIGEGEQNASFSGDVEEENTEDDFNIVDELEDLEDLPSLELAEELTPLDESEEDFPIPGQIEIPAEPVFEPDFEPVQETSTDDSFNLGDIKIEDYNPPEGNAAQENPPIDSDFSMPDFPDAGVPETSSNDDFDGFSPLDLGGSEFDDMPPPPAIDGNPIETNEILNSFDVENPLESKKPGESEQDEKDSVLDSLANFDIDNLVSSASLSSLDDIETTDGILAGSDDDNDNSDDYSIPGFSDFTIQDEFSSPISDVVQNQTDTRGQIREGLTEEEYKTFKANLKEYPLNLKMAIQEVIVKNEFTDDAVFGLIEKVLHRNTARQVASFMSKYLDISIDVPRDFERRSANQYESYKQSIEYQLKNRIIPAFVLIVASIAVVWTLIFLTNRFIYRPLMAEKLYKEGYALLQESMYPQAELTFAEAVSYNPVKKWFFSYARAYREKFQYDRARVMYERILTRFKNDKQAGMEYARMELYDLSNYEFAEEIVKRKILDHHINDKDAMLLLGDVYLEWATERDPSLFPSAFNQYMDLIGLYGSNDEYTKRLLRYYIRTDNLGEVLPLKAYFLTKKKLLGSSDLIELSAFLLNKLYGDLPAKDEYLRSYIEDVRLLLERAIEADPSVPEAYYNFAQYFLETGNKTSAKTNLETAITRFDEAKTRKQKRIYKHIDSYRLLGELYTEEQEYLLSEETFGQGIMLFEKESQLSFLPSTAAVGKLYANIADIDYFIAGDLDQARRNYEKAIDNKYDTASVRYRIGYIQYSNKNYLEALGSFIKSSSEKYDDRNNLLALGNTLSMRGDDFAAQGYYERLIDILDLERSRLGILIPQVRSDQADLVDLYMKASNNLGVTLSRLAQRTGDSSLNAKAMVQMSESLRAWDALTRNPETMIRLDGSNLAAQNIKYLTSPITTFDPAIYSAIPRVLSGEKILEQSFIKN